MYIVDIYNLVITLLYIIILRRHTETLKIHYTLSNFLKYQHLSPNQRRKGQH